MEWRAGAARGAASVAEAQFAFAGAWPRIPVGPVEWTIRVRGAAVPPAAFSFRRVPDFDGADEAPLDWRGAAGRNLDWLLGLPPDPDTEEPWWLTHSWHGEPREIAIAYPALHYPSFATLFLEGLADGPEPVRRGRIEAALGVVADALLRWRTPPGGAYPLMPLTTRIVRNPGPPRAEEGTVTVFRAARVGETLLDLDAWRPRPEFTDYALHVGSVLAGIQRADGSWPYRIRPGTGDVADPYTSAGVCAVRFMERVAALTGDGRFRDAAERAVRWTLDGPCRTRRWQGMYEDVGAQEPFANLENWDALDAVCRLCERGHVEAARTLNRWVEDQFVVFGPGSLPEGRDVHAPAVLEQYVCPYPMEVHTARWIEALRTLARATGDAMYLVKAHRAANAVVRAQFPDGRFSTWGRDVRTGEPLNAEGDWYGCNAIAATALLRLARAEAPVPR